MEERVLLQSNCSLYRVTTKNELDSFCCGDEDLDDFFHQEACLYDGQLLGKTYFFATERSGRNEIVLHFYEKMVSNSCTLQRVWRKRRIIFQKMSTWSQG